MRVDVAWADRQQTFAQQSRDAGDDAALLITIGQGRCEFHWTARPTSSTAEMQSRLALLRRAIESWQGEFGVEP